MTTQESLFSLELVVDSIYIPRATCRFPAIAFRLLDFPTIMIHHVDPELANGMKKRISLDPYYELPYQFKELKDKNSHFSVRKGKSCLYKINAEVLRNHLEIAPLFVMVVDTYPEVAKLVGNCTIPLNRTMEAVCNDIMYTGITIPSVHGAKGTYKLYSLMGSEIGQITLAHRLLSLGPGLLSHIPSAGVMKSKHLSKLEPTVATANQTETDMIVKPMQTDNMPIPFAISVVEKADEKVNEVVQATTLPKPKPKPRKVVPSTQDDDILIMNTVNPPPLFYNSRAESPQWDKTIPQITRKIKQKATQNSEENSTESDVDTICEPEMQPIDQIEPYNEKGFSAVKKTVLHKKPERKQAWVENQETYKQPVLTLQANESNIPPELQLHADSKCLLNFPPGGAQSLPLLNALLSELSLLAQNAAPQLKTITSAPDIRKESSTKVEQGHEMTKKQNKENMKTFVKQMAVPKQKAKRQQLVHKRRCAEPPSQVPKTKGWIRQAPVFGQTKTKLTYGLTNTQRLRLAINNPDLLKTLEDVKKPRESFNGETVRSGYEVNFDQLEISTEVGKHNQTFDSDIQPVVSTKEHESIMNIHKKPVPTPRLQPETLASESKHDVHLSGISEVGKPQAHSSPSASYQSAVSAHISGGTRSIEVHMPGVSMQEQEDDNTSQFSSAFSDGATENNVANDPGFPIDEIQKNTSSKLSWTHLLDQQKTKPTVKTRQRTKQRSRNEILAGTHVIDADKDIVSDKSELGLEPNLPQYKPNETEEPDLLQYEQFEDYTLLKSTADSELNIGVDSNQSEVSYHSVSKHSSHSKSHGSHQQSQKSEFKSERSQESKVKIPPINPVLSSRSPVVGSVRRSSIPGTDQRPLIADRQHQESVDSIDTPRRLAKKSAIEQRRAKLQMMHQRDSFNTESLSSYAPSDVGNLDHLSKSEHGDDYSEDFDTASENE